MASKVLVIGASVRPKRLSPSIAKWVATVGSEALPADYEVVDLKDWPLPMDAEPGIPAMHGYQLDSTKAWSRKVASGDAFVFVSPQYNAGYPAVLKNAIDHLAREWKGKPAVVVTYGSRGGTSVSEQLSHVVKSIGMLPVDTRPQFSIPRGILGENSGVIDAEAELRSQVGPLTQAFSQLDAALKQSSVDAR